MEKYKKFIISGQCVPELHYMADTSRILNATKDMVDNGEYFTINRARQYGKTTTLTLLERKLKDEYIVLRISFEGYGDKLFQSEELFIYEFERDIRHIMNKQIKGFFLPNEQIKDDSYYSFKRFGERITDICNSVNKPIVLLIDEVDKSSNNQLFLSFLGMLRNKYLERRASGEATFQSVILAGVYDIKNIKLRLRPEEKTTYNSPWNIAADFTVDMSLSKDEIAGMLNEYESEHKTFMNISEISSDIYAYTNGYPFLVSAICKIIDDNDDYSWTATDIHRAIGTMLYNSNTLFNDIAKNLENYPKFRSLVERILLRGERIPFMRDNSEISLGLMFGIFSGDGNGIRISNSIFETYIYNYLIIREYTTASIPIQDKNQYVNNGKLNMQLVLERFKAFMYSERRKNDESFIESQGRLLFLCFLKPIINGTGHYAVEPQTRENTRMDIDVFYGNEEFIIELKIWHGENMLKDAEQQLYGYLDSRGADRGYLVCFNFNKHNEQTTGWTTVNGKDIFEIII